MADFARTTACLKSFVSAVSSQMESVHSTSHPCRRYHSASRALGRMRDPDLLLADSSDEDEELMHICIRSSDFHSIEDVAFDRHIPLVTHRGVFRGRKRGREEDEAGSDSAIKMATQWCWCDPHPNASSPTLLRDSTWQIRADSKTESISRPEQHSGSSQPQLNKIDNSKNLTTKIF